MTQAIINFFGFMPPWLQLIIISMIPVVELRGAIPWGIFILHYPFLLTYILCLIGSMIPAPFILLFVQSILSWMKKTKSLRRFALWLDKKADKGSKKIAQYKFWGLLIFVAIPLPGTGVWTGALAASIMEMKFRNAMLSIFGGAVIAGLIISLLCYTGIMVIS